MELIIAVGTNNPVKINSVKLAFQNMYPQDLITVHNFDVPSGISPQPMDTSETIKGARNRATAALLSDAKATYGVGLEGGLELIGTGWFDCGWCCVVDREKQEGIASSARIPTPKLFMDKVNQGLEMGEVIDILFNTKNAKQAEGHFGLMTNNAVTRTDSYVHAVCLAFSRFLHPEMFELTHP